MKSVFSLLRRSSRSSGDGLVFRKQARRRAVVDVVPVGGEGGARVPPVLRLRWRQEPGGSTYPHAPGRLRLRLLFLVLVHVSLRDLQRSFGCDDVLQRSFGAESPQYGAVHRAQPPQHGLNGARVIPVSSPFNQNNPMFRVQSSPNLPNGVAGVGPFKQPPFAMNNAVTNSTVGVYGTR